MNAWLKTHWSDLAGLIVLVLVILAAGLAVRSCYPPTPPKIDIVQQAAQTAASAIVTVTFADSALAQHRADSIRLQGVAKALSSANLKNQALVHTLHQMETNLPVIADTAPTRVWAQRVTDLSHTLDTANAVIASQQGLLRTDSVVALGLVVDNERLAGSLQATRDTLATHRDVVIPATALHKGLDFNPLHLLHVTFGYGVTYAGGKFSTGPQATVGLSIRL